MQLPGIEVMLDLHTNATEQCFGEARRRFDAQLFRESVPDLKEIEQALRDHGAALIAWAWTWRSAPIP